MNYKQSLSDLLAAHLPDVPPAEIFELLETPPDSAMGHFAYPCFKLAKALRKAPPVIAGELAATLSTDPLRPDWLQEAKAVGPYVNLFLARAPFAQAVLSDVLSHADAYGGSLLGENRKILIEYSSPNTAKHFHVGHFANTVIGRALVNIYRRLGYDVTSINYLGDWGTQFGKLITAYLKWGSREEIERLGIDELNRLYVKFHDEAERDPSLNDEARAWVVRLQDGHEEGLSLWRWFCEMSMKDFNRVYDRLNVRFDEVSGESLYSDKMDNVVRLLREQGLLAESDGAQIVDLEPYKMPPCLILRRDGGTLYPTRDIAAAIDRYERYQFEKSVYVTGNEQSLHFAQWMKVVELMGYPWAKDINHVTYGLFVFETGKMSTDRKSVV